MSNQANNASLQEGTVDNYMIIHPNIKEVGERSFNLWKLNSLQKDSEIERRSQYSELLEGENLKRKDRPVLELSQELASILGPKLADIFSHLGSLECTRQEQKTDLRYRKSASARLGFLVPEKRGKEVRNLIRSYVTYSSERTPSHKAKRRESTKAFMDHFEAGSLHVKGALECLSLCGFMHEIANPDLIKRLNNNIPKMVDAMMNVTKAFIRGYVVVANQSKRKIFPSWENHDNMAKPSVARPPVSSFMENRNENKFCEFHGDKGQDTNDFFHLKKKIEEAVTSSHLAHLVKEIKQGDPKRDATCNTLKIESQRKGNNGALLQSTTNKI
ncbi:hypothetical protein Tco_0522721 [Tanacetum coccineum]